MGASVQRNVVMSTTTLLTGWSKVVRIVYRQLRRDGSWQTQDRDLLDRGDGVTVLLCNVARRTVLLLRQPRIVATVAGDATGETIEVCNGQVEAGETSLACALREVEQETGLRLSTLTPVAQVYASPGGSLEIVHLFVGEYGHFNAGEQPGGLLDEGEDIEVFEVPVEQAMAWVDDHTIRDARSIVLLEYAFRRVFSGHAAMPSGVNGQRTMA